MISTSQVVEELISRKPYLEEVISQRIVNYSALARNIKPEIERKLLKKVQNGAIVMALKRLNRRLQNSNRQRSNVDVLKELGDITIRSSLIDLTYSNSITITTAQQKIMNAFSLRKDIFLTISHGINEVTIITNTYAEKEIKKVFKNEKLVSQFGNLSSITIRLKEETTHTPGVYYSILKLLAWENINIVEVISTYTELTIILERKDIDRAFTLLKATND